MANAAGTKGGARGDTQPSQQGLAGLRLQHALPNARVLYASATGASTIHGLAYAPRLGLWGGDATAFNDRPDFVGAMERGGVAAMEIIARDLKALGLYQARALSYPISYHGVEVDILEHALTRPQRDIWDRYAGAFRIIHRHIMAALEATGAVQDGETLNAAANRRLIHPGPERPTVAAWLRDHETFANAYILVVRNHYIALAGGEIADSGWMLRRKPQPVDTAAHRRVRIRATIAYHRAGDPTTPESHCAAPAPQAAG